VVFGDDWGRHVSSMQHLFRTMLGDHTVIWVNGLGHRAPRVAWADIRRAGSKVRSMWRTRSSGNHGGSAQPAAVIEPRVLPWHGSRLIQALNSWSLCRDIRAALTHLAPNLQPIIVTGSPPSVGVIGQLDERLSLYYCMDDFSSLPGVAADVISPLERRLLKLVDAVVATAQALIEARQPASGRSFYLPQGVNFHHFATPRTVPSEMASLRHPIIGFAGGVSACVDTNFIAQLADRFAHGTIVLVGACHIDPKTVRYKNVQLLGHRPYAVLPAYVQAFDVAVIPYILSAWTRAVDPLKLLECLAAGVPVVTTRLPEVEKYRDVVQIADSSMAFVNSVAKALAADSAEQRRQRQAVAQQHTWSRRAATFLSWISELEDEASNAGRGGSGPDRGR